MDISRRQTVGAALGVVALALDPLRANAQVLSSPPIQIDLTSRMRVVSVKSFGAVGDGVSDDSAAINAAINYIRNAPVSAVYAHFGWRLDFPSGQYCVYSSLNLSGIQQYSMMLSGNGSLIIGKCNNKPVIDAFSSRLLSIKDLNIIGDSTHVPNVGIQMGVVNKSGKADCCIFDNVKITGSFSFACLYNRGSENSSFYHNWAWNDNKNGYCIIQDGMNHFNLKSEFVEVVLLVNSDISFVGNVFLNCDFRSLGGYPVWLGDTSNLTFLRCYAATTGEYSFVIFSGPNGNNFLEIDCHCETLTLKSIFLFGSLTQYVNIKGFSYTDHEPFATNSIFSSSSNVLHNTLSGGSINIGVFASNACKIFDDSSKWSFQGNYYSAESPSDSINNEMNGRVMIGFNIYQGAGK